MKDIISYIKDWRIWLLAFALFIFCEFTYGCSILHWDDRGVKLQYPIADDLTLNGKAKTNLKDEYEIHLYFLKTF
jgi:hypothetical protein